jgi:hypothetical protein
MFGGSSFLSDRRVTDLAFFGDFVFGGRLPEILRLEANAAEKTNSGWGWGCEFLGE